MLHSILLRFLLFLQCVGTLLALPEKRFPNDPLFAYQWPLYNPGPSDRFVIPARGGAHLGMPEAWAITTGAKNVTVAILDSGIKLHHKEFANRIWNNQAEIPGNGIDDDQNGYIDDSQGWDFVEGDGFPQDNTGHGTGVAGIIGANSNNDYGFAGVDWNCQLMILRVTGNGTGRAEWLAEAIHYAVENGADVINLSNTGGRVPNKQVQKALRRAHRHGVVVVAAAGNKAESFVRFPASDQHTIAVGATNPDDTWSKTFGWGGGSNRGPQIDLVAPGNFVWLLNHTEERFSKMVGGTSAATAYVTGVVSLLISQGYNRTPAQIRSLLHATADDQVGNPEIDTPGWDLFHGYGRINAYRALLLNRKKGKSNFASALSSHRLSRFLPR